MIGRPSKPPLVDNDDDDGGCDDVDETHGSKCHFDPDIQLMKLIEGKPYFNGEKKPTTQTLGLEGGNAPF